MDVTFANQITLTYGKNEVYLRFAFLHPTFDKEGNVQPEPEVASEKLIMLTPEAFNALKQLINQEIPASKE